MLKMNSLKTIIKNLAVISSSSVLLTLGINASAMAAIFYDIIDLGTLPNSNQSQATDINNFGQVVGVSSSRDGDRAFVWSSQTGIQDIGTLRSDFSSFATSINDAGQVVGVLSPGELSYSTVDFLYNTYLRGLPFLWSSETGIRRINNFIFPSPSNPSAFYNNNQATSINNLGQVLVKAQISAVGFGSYVWDSTNGETIFAREGATSTFAYDINDNGQIAARFGNNSVLLNTENSSVINLGRLPVSPDGFETINQANAINNSGQVVGLSNDKPFFWSERTGIVDLTNSSDEAFGDARDINDDGLVVGQLSTSDGVYAFLWSEETGIIDLNTLIDPSLGWTLYEANAINNKGQIVGTWRNSNLEFPEQGETRAFLLTPRTAEPVPEPITMGGTLLAGVGLAYLRRRQRQLRSSKVAG